MGLQPHLEHRLEAVRLSAEKVGLAVGVPWAHEQRVNVSTCSNIAASLRGPLSNIGGANIMRSFLAVGKAGQCGTIHLIVSA